MATVSSAHLRPTVDDPQRVSIANSDQWDFEVPDPHPTPPQSPPEHSNHTFEINNRPTSPRQRDPATTQSFSRPRPKEIDLNGVNGVNGTGSLGRSSRRKDSTDPAYLSPYKDGVRPPLDGSRSGSEPDSLIDLYHNQKGGPAKGAERALPYTREAEAELEEQDHAQEGMSVDEQSGWIHREKLLQIEKKEMQELGITPPPAPRSHSRSKSRKARDRSRSRDHTNVDGEIEPEVRSAKEGKKRRLQSPTRQEAAPEDVQADQVTLEERALESQADQPSSPIYQQQKLRSSSSRIPLPRSVPGPLPKDASKNPSSHKRNVSSAGGDQDFSTYSPARSRNNSLNVSTVLSTNDRPTTPTTSALLSASPESTPPKLRTSSLPRKSSLSKPRSVNTTPTIRPKSRSGLEPRPPTAINRPEGDPPWLAEMYKPDPRLPPEEQMIPTHAKRLQQEQWEAARKESDARQRALGKPIEAREAGKGKENADEVTRREQVMQGQRARGPLAVHTGRGLVRGNEEAEPISSDVSPVTPAKDEKYVGKSPVVGGYSTLPHLPPTQQRVEGATGLRREGGSAGGGPGVAGDGGPGKGEGRVGFATQVRGASAGGVAGGKEIDPFEKERLELLQRDQDEKLMKAREREGLGAAGEKKGKEVGCTCCVVM